MPRYFPNSFPLEGRHICRALLPVLASLLLLAGALPAQTFDYDDAGRLVRIRFTDGRAVDYAHDAAGNLTSVIPATIPPAPANLAVAAADGANQALTWEDRSESETGFVVQRRVAGLYEWETLATLDPGSTTFTDILSGYSDRFLYRVFATGEADQDSAFSGEVEMTRAAETYFPNTEEIERGWRESETFGVVYTKFFPWIYHPGQGWWFVEGSGDASIYLYDMNLGWLWTRADLFPYLYSYRRRAFLYYDSTIGTTRYFYDFQQQSFFEADLSQ